MRKVIAGIVIGALGIYAYNRFRADVAPPPAVAATDPRPLEVENSAQVTAKSGRYRCDGRVYCSQMTSCDEATWFLQNCPDVKMDGEGDGVPCERQWCGHR